MKKDYVTYISMTSFLLLAIFFSTFSDAANKGVFAATPNNSTPVLFPLDAFPTTSPVGTPIVYQLSAFDLDGDPLTYSVNSHIPGATLDSTTGIFSWTPAANQTGTYTIDFSVTDGIDTDNLSTSIVIEGTQVVEPPVISQMANQTIPVGSALAMLVTATSPTGLPVTISVQAPQGAVYNTQSQTFSWAPTLQDVGQHTVAFTATDGTNSVSKSITITVTAPVIQPPVFGQISNQTITEGQSLSLNVSATSPNNLPVTITAQVPSGASFNSTTNTLNWTPTSQNIGTYNVAFTATDGTNTVTKSITITVTATPAVSQPPVIKKIENQTIRVGRTLTFKVYAYSPAGLPIKISYQIPDGAKFNTETKTFTWTPSSRKTGTYYAKFKASDGINSTSRTVKIEVKRSEESHD